MSLRKAKLLLEQKKLLEQSALNKKDEEQQQQQTQVKPKKNSNLFQALQEDQQQQPNVDIKQQASKQQQKDTEKQDKKKKNKKKKKKAKQENKKEEKQQKEQDIQEILKQLGMDNKNGKKQQKQQDDEWIEILHINQSKFNYEKQLKRHFGNVGSLNQEKADEPDMNKRQQRLQKHLKKMMKKSMLSPGIKEAFPIRQKFQLERNDSLLKFLPTKKYAQYQVEYEAIRNSNDINALFFFMQSHPEHVDSTYAVGEFIRLQGNYREADNLIQRVIYIYQMAAGFDFGEFVKEDFIKKQFVYDQWSTSLFMALFKFMDILGKKGCYRSALQYNKLLLKINLADPTACILCIDFNSISSKSSDYLVKFISGFSKYLGNKKSSLYLLPNFTYSIALAKYYIESEKKQEKQLLVQKNNTQKLLKFVQQDWKKALILPSDESFATESANILMLRAILVYPRLIVEIANKNQYAKQFLNHPSFQANQKKSFKDILAHDFWSIIPSSYSYHFLKLQNVADSNGLDKVLEVYVERSKILWKSNQIMLWVKGAMGFILNKIDAKQFDYQEYLQRLCTEQSGGMEIPFQLSRYANISKANFSDRVERIDLANIQDNQRQNAPRNQNRMNLQGNPISMFLQSLLPWVNLPNSQGNQDPDMPDIQQDD